MELNGPANIKMLIQGFEAIDTQELFDEEYEAISKMLKSIDSEADMIMNYLKEIDQVLKANGLQDKVPFWHEVKEKYGKSS